MILILAAQGKDIQEQAIRKARMVVSHFSFCLKWAIRKTFLAITLDDSKFLSWPPRGEISENKHLRETRMIISCFVFCLKWSLSFVYPRQTL
jgi:hypothetical protein